MYLRTIYKRLSFKHAISVFYDERKLPPFWADVHLRKGTSASPIQQSYLLGSFSKNLPPFAGAYSSKRMLAGWPVAALPGAP